ncbi:amidase [Pochonia chlamydosporia 170]|uniref:Amidase n=1 Tax=Pochonia chlamydosporia 170 TaxID=1380566 RepID=A0A179G5Z9_METCM|nr:amidase [Pochonia chlamydosporia 170]OAQ72793.1 amidase [Pochonia chlamydosporia 170]
MAARDPCPKGSQFYACDSNKFRGCCSSDPCSLPNCPRGVPERDENDLPQAGASTNVSSKADAAKTDVLDPDDSKSTTKTTSAPTETKTDSGITHTIPNSSIVTITKHTVIFSEAPSPSTASLSESNTVPAPATTCSGCDTSTQTVDPEDTEGGARIAPGAIAGFATGGVVILALVAYVWIMVRRRKRAGANSDMTGDEDAAEGSRVNGYEKVTPHTTGTEESADLFAPFGGRADQLYEPYPPQSGTFEMDGSSLAPVELPAISISEAPDNTIPPTRHTSPTSSAVIDPRATLASGPGQQKPQYVNQWNQYKAMAEDKEQTKE